MIADIAEVPGAVDIVTTQEEQGTASANNSSLRAKSSGAAEDLGIQTEQPDNLNYCFSGITRRKYRRRR